ncbi:MAG: hypothetical protein HYR84_04640 [Planctomycetes bacterium]|nr:hypothetical protein [Planctomycetota bacterium]
MRTRSIFRAVLGCGLALLWTAGFGFAQPAESKLPEGLRHVPADALGFVHVRTGDFAKSLIGQSLLQQIRADREASKGLKKFEQTLGIDATEIESVTALILPLPKRSQFEMWDGPGGRLFDFRPRYEKKKDWRDWEKKDMPFPPPKFEDKKADIDKDEKKTSADRFAPVLFQDFDERRMMAQDLDPMAAAEYLSFSGPLFVVTATKPLDRKAILRSKIFQDGPHEPFSPRPSTEYSALFLSDRSVLIGVPWELARHSELMARNPEPKARPMQAALELGEKPHLVVAGGYLPAELRRMFLPLFMRENDMRWLAAISPLWHTEAALTLDLGASVDVALQFKAPNAAAAGNALQAVKSWRVLAEFALEKSKDAGEAGGWKLDL